jgi:hypothetical protein
VQKVETIRAQISQETIKSYVNLLNAIRLPYTLEISNYTVRLRSATHNIYFLRNEQSTRVFSVAAMIKADLKNKQAPDVPDQLLYYDVGRMQNVYLDVATNADLKSAYASILFNDGFISEKTHTKLTQLNKIDRLAAVGMLASKKDIFNYAPGGELIEHVENRNELAPFFFYCVNKTGHIISDLRQNLVKDKFLFSWVDGIYIAGKDSRLNKNMQQYTEKEHGIKLHINELKTFESKQRREFYEVSFLEVAKNKMKNFNVPIPESSIKKQLINYLLKKDY